jgi:hypothetical protein
MDTKLGEGAYGVVYKGLLIFIIPSFNIFQHVTQIMNTKKNHLDIVQELVEIYYNQVKAYLNIFSINFFFKFLI